jgi:hypothetical protein
MVIPMHARARTETFIQYLCRAARIKPGETVRVPDSLLDFYGDLYVSSIQGNREAMG